VIKTQEQLATLSSPRSDARVTLPDGRVFSAPVGTSLVAYMEAAFPPGHPDRPIVGAIVDNRLTELVGPVQRDVTVLPVNLRHSDGARIYRRSLVFLLACAVEEIWPEVKIAVQHTIPSGGYCEVVGVRISARPNCATSGTDGADRCRGCAHCPQDDPPGGSSGIIQRKWRRRQGAPAGKP
jgi:hypothetical protein